MTHPLQKSLTSTDFRLQRHKKFNYDE